MGAKALSLKDGVVNWWRRDHAIILDRGFHSGLFVGLLWLCSQFSVIDVVTVAALLRGKDISEALTAAAKILVGEKE